MTILTLFVFVVFFEATLLDRESGTNRVTLFISNLLGSRRMAWVYLFIASLFEVGWAISLKYAQGFTKLGPSVATIALMIFSFAFLSIAFRTLPVGTAYTVWTGIGSVGTVILGIVLFQEPVEVRRFICIGLIIAGVLGLRLVSSH